MRRVGSLSVSSLGLGCNQFGRKLTAKESAVVFDAALDAGINLFDTSDRYGYGSMPFSGHGVSEEYLGRALAGRRDRVIVATKFGGIMGPNPEMRGASSRWTRLACEGSLRRLGVDHIDLYQLHKADPETSIDETLGTLTELVREGKVREIGCCNFNAEQLHEAMRVSVDQGHRRFASIQNEYSLMERSPETNGVLAVCREYGVPLVPYFPLAGGLLTGKYTRAEDPPEGTRLSIYAAPRSHLEASEVNLMRVQRLSAFAAERGRTLLELAFAWLYARSGVGAVFAGATSPAQVRTNVAAATSWTLSVDELAAVDAI